MHGLYIWPDHISDVGNLKEGNKMQKEIEFQGVIELKGDNDHIEQHLIWEMLDRLTF